MSSLLQQKSFDDVYDEFVFACSHGDYLTVDRLLGNGSISNDDITTTVGEQTVSPIVVAIEHNHLQVIKVLLDHLPYSGFREALLLAIYLDLTKVAQFIMEHETFRCFYGTFADWQTDAAEAYDESHFGAIRPIQLAAQYNRTMILYNFLKRGERIEVPHDIECQCNECKSAGLSDSLRHSQLRLSAYRGLSSDVYLALVSKDPITNAFHLSNDLAKLIETEAHFRSEYLSLFNQILYFTARLLDHTRNQTELELLLTSERLTSAIANNQQEFITHTNTQQRLTDMWYHHIDRVKSDALRNRLLAAAYYVILYIPMYIAHFWLPTHLERHSQWYFKQAAIQALLHTVTYIAFLLMLVFSSILRSYETLLKEEYPRISSYYQHLLEIGEEELFCKPTIVTALEVFVLVWMLGYVLQNVSTMIRKRQCLEIMDLSTTVLFILYISLSAVAAIQSHLEWRFILNVNGWERLTRLQNESQVSSEYIRLWSRFEHTFILYRRDKHTGWNNNFERNDVKIIADVLFTLILVFCIVHLSFFLLISEYFGPLLVSLTIMSKIIHRWFIFIFTFIFAYHTSFLHIFSYYFTEEEYNYFPSNTTDRVRKAARISRSFGDLKRLTINIFFTLFGLVQNELTKTYTGKGNDCFTGRANDTSYYFLKSFTWKISSGIYGSFAFGARIIFITLIIAYIKRLYKLNRHQALNNWKFARAKLFMKYLTREPDSLPVPLNLVPTPRHMINWFRKRSSSASNTRETFSQANYLRSLNYVSHQYDSPRKLTSEEVMDCVVLRFLTEHHPFDMRSSKRTREMQYKEELLHIRHHMLDEVQMLEDENKTLSKHISTVFFDIDKY